LAAREKGWQASGVDIGKETCAFTQGLGLEVREGDVLELDIKGPVDAICVWNTFDQINRPGPLLDRCHELLKAGGQLVIRVPNGAFESACLDLAKRDLQSVRTAQAYNNFLTFPYLCGYTPGSITALLARHGFNVTSLHGDVIVPLAGSDTKPCAIEEEVRYKRLVHRLCTRWLTRTGEFLYPWMDVVATAAS
jgi:SAM-dependent methyltransferase